MASPRAANFHSSSVRHHTCARPLSSWRLILIAIAALVLIAGSYALFERKRLFVIAVVLSVTSILTTGLLLITQQLDSDSLAQLRLRSHYLSLPRDPRLRLAWSADHDG